MRRWSLLRSRALIGWLIFIVVSLAVGSQVARLAREACPDSVAHAQAAATRTPGPTATPSKTPAGTPAAAATVSGSLTPSPSPSTTVVGTVTPGPSPTATVSPSATARGNRPGPAAPLSALGELELGSGERDRGYFAIWVASGDRTGDQSPISVVDADGGFQGFVRQINVEPSVVTLSGDGRLFQGSDAPEVTFTARLTRGAASALSIRYRKAGASATLKTIEGPVRNAQVEVR